jgi:hypothetical protein
MSTLQATNLKHASSASNNIVLDSSGNATFAGTAAMASSFLRNRIINGGMAVSQRNGTSSVNISSDAYSLDRWLNRVSGGGVITNQQTTSVVPTGQAYAAVLTVQTADASIAAGDVYDLEQRIEGFNTADLGWGTASAQTVTLSFWVRSSVTGTYGVGIQSAAYTRSYVTTYTINVANTWEFKTLTIPGDTSGTQNVGNGLGVGVCFDLGSGSNSNTTAGAWGAGGGFFRTSGCVNWIANAGATFYITGVQLEVGSAATPFERRQYGQELALCQRYFQTAGSGAYGSFDGSTTTIQIAEKLMPTMRTTPTASIRSGVNAAFRSTGADFTATSPGLANFSSNANAIGEGIAFWTQVTGFTGGTSNAVVTSRNSVATNGGAFINLSAEL